MLLSIDSANTETRTLAILDKRHQTEMRAEIKPEVVEALLSDTSRPFEKPKSGRIAVKIINQRDGEMMKVFKIQ